MQGMLAYLLIALVKVLIVFSAMMLIVAYMTLMERKVLGHMQVRFGPNRVGPFGLFQPIADGIKLFFKEDIIVPHANKVIYIFAPTVIVITALVSFAVIPFGDSDHHPGEKHRPGRRRCERGASLPLRHLLPGRVRGGHGRLGLEQQILPPGRHPLLGPDDQLRALPGPLASSGCS